MHSAFESWLGYHDYYQHALLMLMKLPTWCLLHTAFRLSMRECHSHRQSLLMLMEISILEHCLLHSSHGSSEFDSHADFTPPTLPSELEEVAAPFLACTSVFSDPHQGDGQMAREREEERGLILTSDGDHDKALFISLLLSPGKNTQCYKLRITVNIKKTRDIYTLGAPPD